MSMSATYDEIRSFLDDKGYHYETHDEGYIIMRLGMKTYRNPIGDRELMIEIRLPYEGTYFKAFAPGVYQCKESPNKAALLQLLAQIRKETPLIRFIYDRTSGEVSIGIEFPLDDAKLTSQQLFSVLSLIVEAIEVCHPMISQAINKGIIPLPEPDGITDLLAGASPEELREVLEEIRRRKSPKCPPPLLKHIRALSPYTISDAVTIKDDPFGKIFQRKRAIATTEP